MLRVLSKLGSVEENGQQHPHDFMTHISGLATKLAYNNNAVYTYYDSLLQFINAQISFLSTTRYWNNTLTESFIAIANIALL